jgi:hypothetical protein
MSLHSDTLSWFWANQSALTLNAECREATNTNVIVFGSDDQTQGEPDQTQTYNLPHSREARPDSNLQSTTLKGSQTRLKPTIYYTQGKPDQTQTYNLPHSSGACYNHYTTDLIQIYMRKRPFCESKVCILLGAHYICS